MSFCWVTINVMDMERSLAFYREVVGLALNRRMKPMPGTDIAFLGSGDTEVELIRNEKATSCSYGKDVSLGFKVDSLEKTIEFLKEKGVPVQSGPFQPSPTVRFLYVLDPDGMRIQFVEDVK